MRNPQHGPWLAVVAGLGTGLAFLLLVILTAAAHDTRLMVREKASGYTTLNGINLAVEQRHPLTGVVIRAAGAPALSKQEFAALLGR